MIIPVETSYSGNLPVARLLTTIALSEMAKTERLMEFQNLQQWSRIVNLAPGVTITTSKSFGIRKVNVNVAIAGDISDQSSAICLCNCNFAFGVVIEVQTDKLERDGSTLYTAIVCRNKHGYVVVKNLLATDFSKYLPGQKIILIPYNGALYRCCENISIPTGCMPMRMENDISEEVWRATMRIVPWRAFNLQKWIQSNG